jgi:hypothetical protein
MSCLFEALAPRVNMTHTSLRKLLIAYIGTNPTLMDDLSTSEIIELSGGGTILDYITFMESTYSWGGAIEIKAFADLFRFNVIIKVLYTGKEFIVKSKFDSVKTITLTYTGNHFEIA